MEEEKKVLKISVRNLVEFVLRSGAVTGKDAAAAGGKTP